ncbi:MAG: RNA-binding protein YhbY [Deltaproteobacteria bacterium]|jgi:RNA-binding protein|nr:RNA-binding protein YhbY [Deltaproteobacteria bacterium]
MTGKQKRHLRTLAHQSKPVVNLGKQGLSSKTRREIKSQLLEHELIKLKVLDSCPITNKECADELNQVSGFEVVQIIGKTFTLYCPHPEEPKIQLPAE